MSKHFLIYITITGIVGEERIDLAYPIRGKVVTVISLFSDNIQPNPNPESSYTKVIIYHIPLVSV